MTLTDSFPGPTGITDSIEAGKDVAALLMHENGVPKAGVTWKSATNLLAARSDMRVDIAPFKAALVRNGAARLLANDSTTQSPQLTIPNANSVIAVLYVKVGESEIVEGETNGPFFGVVYGDPAPVPAKPTLNVAGALELGTVLIPSNATGTASAGVKLETTAPVTAAAGGSLAPDMRQNDTTNVVIQGRIQTGIGKIQGTNGNQLVEQVTFPTPFSGIPVVFVSYIGYRGTGAYNPEGLVAGSAQRTSPMVITKDGFRAYINSDGSLTSGSDFYYQWFAFGPV